MNIIIDDVEDKDGDNDVDYWIAMATTHPDDTGLGLFMGNF